MSLNKPIITTIIPTYRRPVLLKRAIESVLNQTYPHFQVCIYDNASGDDTADMVTQMAQCDDRIKYYCHPENIGAIKNFQYGFEQVSTPFFSFLSDDDMLLPNFYQIALTGFDKYPESMFSSAATMYMDIKGNHLGIKEAKWKPGFYQPPVGLFAMLQFNHPTWTGILFRQEVKELVGKLDLETGPFSDMDFELRLAARFPFVVSMQPGAILSKHSGSYSQSSATRINNIWPYIENMCHNITGDERLDPDTRQRAEAILRRYCIDYLFRIGIASILHKNFTDNSQTVDILRTQYHLSVKGSCLSALTKICQYFPPAYYAAVFLNNFRWYIRRKRWRILKPQVENSPYSLHNSKRQLP